ncbi:MAG: glucosyl-glycerol phosphate synthase [Candidatus Atelocyanobacterium thalassa isolate SIO64986]|uniref:Glucosyl-glycerol phosphate synthase n=1 Tax=Candidatus Atelocyanobacterium thalassa isolate SIO64986 TaxID=1527444 RepID=A0A086CIQ6_9CHRO|nr:MAG: glucosyl-glycerol phosphate synthase [Candidatus Atelocyanobacterium thalassa isolate SIO64986]
MKSSLVILYHREPHDEVIENGTIRYVPQKSPNGIIPTLKSFFANNFQGTWIAWKQVTEKQKNNFSEKVSVEDDGNYHVFRIPLSPEQVKSFYYITSKEAFWPILHSFPYHFTSESSDWNNFVEINCLFAEAACRYAEDNALVWVHDYNLWLAPYFIRQKKPNIRIAFFHHTPFPPVDIFNILPWREAIIDSLLSCDLVGFHIPRYSENFINATKSLRSIDILEQQRVPKHLTAIGTALAQPDFTTKIKHNNQIIKIDAFPVGTNPKDVLQVLHSEYAIERFRKIKKSFHGCKTIIAAGRVDYVKGNAQKLETFNRLLKRRPELHGKINFILTCVQAATEIRIYKEAQYQVEQLVGAINGRYSSLDWTPVSLFTKPVSLLDLFCYYKAADICWTTPLRDGLNLVAKEYIIAHEGRSGVLILSEFVGAAIELPQAILVNPYSTKLMDEAIDKALDMSEEEQEEKMTEMYKTVSTYDIKYWANRVSRHFSNNLKS